MQTEQNAGIEPEYSEIDWPTEPNKRAIAVLNDKGDVKCVWDMTDPDDVANAERAFAELRSKGHLIFATNGAAGGGGGQRDRLDPERNHVAVRQMQGG